MGLQRLWVVPRGAGPAEGAYLRYPMDDLVRLLALELHRHRAIVIGEDLGTLPEGFHDRMEKAGILGMKVLWFEQEQDGRFRAPRHWPRNATAMTTTHDLPTVVGWWQGRDITWRGRARPLPGCGGGGARGGPARARTAPALWTAFLESGAATGDQPGPRQTDAVVDAALAHVGGAGCAPRHPAARGCARPCRSSRTCPARSTSIRIGAAACRAMPPTLLDAPEVARRLELFARPASRAGNLSAPGFGSVC